MSAGVALPPEIDVEHVHQRVFRWSQTFAGYESLLSMRGERASPRIYFSEGTIELVSPCIDHRAIATTLARLLEAWADERGLRSTATARGR